MTYALSECPVGFADSELIEYAMRDREFVAVVRAWNAATIRATFRDTIAVCDGGAWAFSSLDKLESPTPFQQQALAYQLDVIPDQPPYSSYVFGDPDGRTVLEVIARDCRLDVASPQGQDGESPDAV